LLKPLPRELVVACSGGVDSMAVIDFLRRKHTVTAAFYHHDTPNSDRAAVTVARYCTDNHIPLLMGTLSGTKPEGLSQEEWWRNCRYEFLDGIGTTLGPVVTAHHLDDSTETYLWGALHGTPKVIPYSRGNVVRPFLTTLKQEFIDWCTRHDVQWAEDTSNQDTAYTRNYIRREMMPLALRVNPGLTTTVRKIIEKQISVDNTLGVC